MCDPVLIAAILEEMGYFDEKKEDNIEEIPDEESMKENPKNKAGRKRINEKCCEL